MPTGLRKQQSPFEKANVILELFATLEQAGVTFCHWKSNCRLEATLAGREDADVLVQRQDSAKFAVALESCGFKLTRSRMGIGHPGVFHAIGLDESSSQLVDLHACYQIVGGDSLVKNYRLEIEQSLFSPARTLHGVRVPAPEAELALFVWRTALKHVSPVEVLKSNLHYERTLEELRWLRETADVSKAEALSAMWFPEIEPGLFRQFLDAMENRNALARRIALGWKVAMRLRGLRRLNTIEALASRLWRLLPYAQRRFSQRRDLSLSAGGMIVALVGPKATGKSTIASELAAKLGRHLDVIHIHAGKPPSSALSLLPNLLVPIARRLFPHERLSEYENPGRRQKREFSLFYVVRMTLLAYDRKKLLRRALRRAVSGTIIISDRYPSDTQGAIDSSCFDEIAVKNCRSNLKRWLMKKEKAFYQGLPKPALVIRLSAPVETALQRDAERNKTGGPDAAAVLRRWDLENCAEFAGSTVITLNTAQSLDETVRKALHSVWVRL